MTTDVAIAIREAFGWRSMPSSAVSVTGHESDIQEDAQVFSGLPADQVDVALLERYPFAIYGFSPQAFSYYLPAVMVAVHVSARTDLLVVDALLTMLDTSGDQDSQPASLQHFWSDLTKGEFAAVERWVHWLSGFPGVFAFENQCDRIKGTLRLLALNAPG